MTRAIRTVIADESVIVTPSANPILGSLPQVEPTIFDNVAKIAATLWSGVPVVPTMEPFGSDGRFLRAAGIPTYGISGLFDDVDDVRSHGKDERISVRVFSDGPEFHYRFAKASQIRLRQSGDKQHGGIDDVPLEAANRCLSEHRC